MNKFTRKSILSAVIFVIFLIPIITSSLLDLEQKRINEIAEQKLLAEERARKDAEEKIYLLGKFDPSTREDFALVPGERNVAGYKIYLRKETLGAFLKMAEEARKSGVELNLASATRNFNYQKNLWNDKWNAITLPGNERFKKILEYSAVPGTSRHHWGTDIDINNVNPPYFNSERGKKEYQWLVENAMQFGFCQTYTEKGPGRLAGYNEEKWHWSYLPLARDFTQDYKRLIGEKDINGFDGDQYVIGQDLISSYVLSINPDCL